MQPAGRFAKSSCAIAMPWLMIAAVKAGVPAPRVRAILKPDDGLGPGYVTERVAGERLA